jgi:nitrogen fixation protein NifQ
VFAQAYATLMAGRRPPRDAGDAFDGHVFACVLAAALCEIEDGGTLTEATGLAAGAIAALLADYFPHAPRAPFALDGVDAPVVEMEEELVRDLLLGYGRPGDATAATLACLVARRAMRDHHLWQDLGLFERGELTRLLSRHFPGLAAGNTKNMRWKKYFYRKLCEAEGFSLCTAPTCTACADFSLCFGAEDGESRFARMKQAAVA